MAKLWSINLSLQSCLIAASSTDHNRITCVDTSSTLVAAGTLRGDVIIYRLQPSVVRGGKSDCYAKKVLQVCPPSEDGSTIDGSNAHCTCIAISPSGNFIAIGTVGGLVVVFEYDDNGSNGKSNLHILYDHNEHSGNAITVLKWSMSSDRLKLFSGCEGGIVSELNISTVLLQRYHPSVMLSFISLLRKKPVAQVCKTPLSVESIDCSYSLSPSGPADLLLVSSAGQLLLFCLPADEGTAARYSHLSTKATYKDIEKVISCGCFINSHSASPAGDHTIGAESICVLSKRLGEGSRVWPVAYICALDGQILDECVLAVEPYGGDSDCSLDFSVLSLCTLPGEEYKGLLFGVTSDSSIAAIDLAAGTLRFVDFHCSESQRHYFRRLVYGVSAGRGGLAVLHEEGLSDLLLVSLISVSSTANPCTSGGGGVLRRHGDIACYDMGLRAAVAGLRRAWKQRRSRRVPLSVHCIPYDSIGVEERVEQVQRAIGAAIDGALVDDLAQMQAGDDRFDMDARLLDEGLGTINSARKATRRRTLELVSRGVDNYASTFGGAAGGAEELLREADGVVRITRMMLRSGSSSSSSSSSDHRGGLGLAEGAMSAEQLMDASEMHIALTASSPLLLNSNPNFESKRLDRSWNDEGCEEGTSAPTSPSPDHSCNGDCGTEPSFLRDSAPFWSDTWRALTPAHPLKGRIGRLKVARSAFYCADRSLLGAAEVEALARDANISKAFQSSGEGPVCATPTTAPSSVILQPPQHTYSITVSAPCGLGLSLAVSSSGSLRVSGFSDLDQGDRSPCKLSCRIAVGDALISINGMLVHALALDSVSATLSACCSDNGGEVALVFMLAAYCIDEDIDVTSSSACNAQVNPLFNPLQRYSDGGEDELSSLVGWGAGSSTTSIDWPALALGVDGLVRNRWLLDQNSSHDGMLFRATTTAAADADADGGGEMHREVVERCILENHMYPTCAVTSALPDPSSSRPSPTAQLDSLAEELWEWRRIQYAAQQSALFSAAEGYPPLLRPDTDTGVYRARIDAEIQAGSPSVESPFLAAVVERLRCIAVEERRSEEVRETFFMRFAEPSEDSGTWGDADVSAAQQEVAGQQEQPPRAAEELLQRRAQCEQVLRLQHLCLPPEEPLLPIEEAASSLEACARRQLAGEPYSGMHSDVVAQARRLPPCRPSLSLLYSAINSSHCRPDGDKVRVISGDFAAAFSAAMQQWLLLFDPCPPSQRTNLRDLYSNFLEASVHGLASGVHMRELVHVVEDLLGLQLLLHCPVRTDTIVRASSSSGGGNDSSSALEGRCFNFLPLKLAPAALPSAQSAESSLWSETEVVSFVSLYAAYIHLDACALVLSRCAMGEALDIVLGLAMVHEEYSRATSLLLSKLRSSGAETRARGRVRIGAVIGDITAGLSKDFRLSYCLVVANLGFMLQKHGSEAVIFAARAFPQVSTWNVRRALLGDACGMLSGDDTAATAAAAALPREWVHEAKRLYHRYLAHLVYRLLSEGDEGGSGNSDGGRLSLLIGAEGFFRTTVLREWLPLSLYLCTCGETAALAGDDVLRQKLAAKLHLRGAQLPLLRVVTGANGAAELAALGDCDAVALLCVHALASLAPSSNPILDKLCVLSVAKACLGGGLIDCALRVCKSYVSTLSEGVGASANEEVGKMLLDACGKMLAVVRSLFSGQESIAAPSADDNNGRMYAIKTATRCISLLHLAGADLQAVVSAIDNSLLRDADNTSSSSSSSSSSLAQIFGALLVGALGASRALALVATSQRLLCALDVTFFASIAADPTTFEPNARLLE